VISSWGPTSACSVILPPPLDPSHAEPCAPRWNHPFVQSAGRSSRSTRIMFDLWRPFPGCAERPVLTPTQLRTCRIPRHPPVKLFSRSLITFIRISSQRLRGYPPPPFLGGSPDSPVTPRLTCLDRVCSLPLYVKLIGRSEKMHPHLPVPYFTHHGGLVVGSRSRCTRYFFRSSTIVKFSAPPRYILGANSFPYTSIVLRPFPSDSSEVSDTLNRSFSEVSP